MTCAARRCPLSSEADSTAAGSWLETRGWQSIQNADRHVNGFGALSNGHLAADWILESHVPAQPLDKGDDTATGRSCSAKQSPTAQTRHWDAPSQRLPDFCAEWRHSSQHCLMMTLALILVLHLSAVSAATPASSPAAVLRSDGAHTATGYHDHAISSSLIVPAAPAVSRAAAVSAGSKPFDSISDGGSDPAGKAASKHVAGSKTAGSTDSLQGRQLQTAQRDVSKRAARPIIPPGYSTGYSYYNPADFPLPPGYR